VTSPAQIQFEVPGPEMRWSRFMALVPGRAIVVHRRRRRHRPAYTGWEARDVRRDQVEENDSLGVELRECLADPEL
jgi:hypothetical protein